MAANLEHRREIDGLRACAVLAVVACHTLQAKATYHIGPPWPAIGARGVDLFFVISGFCLSWPYASNATFSAASLLTFLRRRVTRIAPACWVALALFASLSMTPFGLPVSEVANVSAYDQAIEVFRDAIFFPTLLPIHDPPVWSLGVEMRWYVLFLPLLLVFFRSRVTFALIGVACYVAYAHVGVPDLGALPSFMLGIVAASVAKSRAKANAIWPFVAIAAFVAAMLEQFRWPWSDHGDPLWAFACFALIAAVTTNATLRRVFAWRPLTAVGVASYSIYLVHDPILNALANRGMSPLFAAVAAIATGFTFWFAVERPLGSSKARRAMDAWMLGVWRLVVGRHAAPLVGIPGVAEEPS